ncbi:glycerophosphodiester phosphodiesterase family protein [Dermatophilaceae bacterium Soc4.6]
MRPPLVIAHRGSSGELPEHTLAAYERAIEQGADGIECDVRLSADGELVCLHDRTLDRTGGGPGVVSTMTLAQLRDIDWGAWRHRAAAGTDPAAPRTPRTPGDDRLVTLRELVELTLDAGRPMGLAIETKHPTRSGGRVEHAVAELLRGYGLTHRAAPGRPWARAMSFSALAVRRMTGLLPSLPTVALVTTGSILLPLRGALPGGAGTAGLDLGIVRHRPEVVRVQRAAGREIFVWTVDEPDDLSLCCELEVDAIITNHPQRALDVTRLSG